MTNEKNVTSISTVETVKCDSINHSGTNGADFSVVIVPSITAVGGIKVAATPTTVNLCRNCFASTLGEKALEIVSAKSLSNTTIVADKEVKHRRTKAEMAAIRAAEEAVQPATNGTVK